MATKAHINKQEGTRPMSLMKEAERLCCWAEKNVLSMKAEHISGSTNVWADWLSMATIDYAEWCKIVMISKNIDLHISFFLEVIRNISKLDYRW